MFVRYLADTNMVEDTELVELTFRCILRVHDALRRDHLQLSPSSYQAIAQSRLHQNLGWKRCFCRTELGLVYLQIVIGCGVCICKGKGKRWA